MGARPGDVDDAPRFSSPRSGTSFTVYKQLEPGKSTRCYGREGVEVADAVVRAAQRRARRAATTGTKP
ncbi:MAG TPA: hypothetical protein VK923_15430 [Euzebyales bacterium]|nr:hypothetical protein [Euzebyales bacterium]